MILWLLIVAALMAIMHFDGGISLTVLVVPAVVGVVAGLALRSQDSGAFVGANLFAVGMLIFTATGFGYLETFGVSWWWGLAVGSVMVLSAGVLGLEA